MTIEESSANVVCDNFVKVHCSSTGGKIKSFDASCDAQSGEWIISDKCDGNDDNIYFIESLFPYHDNDTGGLNVYTYISAHCQQLKCHPLRAVILAVLYELGS